MNSKYDKKRPAIPASVKRAAAVESGHACAIRNCIEHTYNEYHHIDENRENNSIENLIYLCDKHHKMVHSGKIDRKSLREYKKLNTINEKPDEVLVTKEQNNRASLPSSHSSLEDIYTQKCEDEEILVEFCQGVVKHNDFLVSTGTMISKGVVETEVLNRILKSLAEVFHKNHLLRLFQLGCMLYDKVDIDDSLFKNIKNRGFRNEEITQCSSYIPKRASLNLCRIFFTAFFEEKIEPIPFQSAVMSPKFASYCGEIDSIRTRDLMLDWSAHPNFIGHRASDAIYCAKLIAKEVGIEGDFFHIQNVVKRWMDNKEIYESLVGCKFTSENVQEVIGYKIL